MSLGRRAPSRLARDLARPAFFGLLGCLVVLHVFAVPAGSTVLPVYRSTIGEEVTHPVAAGETLGLIARQFGVKVQLIAAINRLPDAHRLRCGQALRISNRHIVPATATGGIVINVAELRLYWVQDGMLMATFPAGVGRNEWETPVGRYTIAGRRRDPVWHVPLSIQREMKAKGQPVKKSVPPGNDNPLGKYWLQLSSPSLGIHGTNAPWSVGKYATHGCIRLRPDDIEWLFGKVPTGTPVEIVDEPIKIARLADDRVLIEAHPGAAGQARDLTALVLEQLHGAELSDLVDLPAAQRVAGDALGIAIDVSKPLPATVAER